MSKRMIVAGKLKGNNGTLVVDQKVMLEASLQVIPEALLDNLLAFSKAPGQTTMWYDREIANGAIEVNWEHKPSGP